ncbi:MAG TPA: alginate lyase family protein, partial [Vicinamibacterales bacterium]
MNRRATLAPASVRGASTLASVRAALARASFMDARELRTRFATLLRINAGRMRFSVSKPKWNRQHILSVVDPSSAPLLREACTRMQSGDVMAAHRALAAHLVSRPSHWPLKGSNRERLAASINARFPEAAAEARDGADRILDGRIDLLGYRELRVGNPPAWNRDPVHRRQAPLDTYWADVRFLDPSIGDHKVIWELNRHQHFVTLGTAYWLTGDARYRTAFMQQLEDWVNANQPLAGVNWSSMLELAFRAMSWTWAVEFFAAGAEEDTSPWLIDLFVALDRQLSHVADNLSTYFSPNTHLTGEALALYAVSAAFPELRRSRERAATGRDILLREAAGHQVRPDGGHAELSAHYHRYSTDFYLLACLIARAIGDNAAPAFERAARCQAAYLRTIGDGTGRLPGTGDDDGGRLFRFDAAPAWDASSTLSAAAAALEDPSLAVASARAETFWILGEPVDPSARSADQSGSRRIAVWPSRMLADTGYFVSRSAGGGHLLFDGGPHGFLNGGHAHSDALSLVLTVLDLPLLVDPGTATYTMDPAARDRFRSARMHNTIVFDGRDPSQPAGPFRWRRRTDARFLVTRTRHDFDFAVAALAGRASTHMRAVLAVHGAGWMIVDRITPPEPIAADIWWHLHPMWTARR